MAISRNKRSNLLKVGIAVICAILVLSFIPWGGLGVFNQTPTNGQVSLEALASRHQPGITLLEGQLASDPASYTVLVGLGRAYSVWASDVMRANTTSQAGYESTLWLSANSYFERALAVDSTVPSDMTDAAIARFYSGDTAGAIELVDQVRAIAPDFAPAYFNAGIFYESAGRTTEAVSAYQRYLQLDPQGTGPGNPAAALSSISRLSAATPTVGATTPPAPTAGATIPSTP